MIDPATTRPIVPLSVVGKLFALVIEKRLSDWSERTGAISDEQGGFRRSRGTPDQIFLLREIITSRKERGLPTLVTYIDARKAYDTVWRDGNYVRLFDLGVQGKMWRQIQAMGTHMRSKVRLEVGETEWHEVRRGVAQGAVESPWLYSCYVDGMAAELKARGLGIMIEGRRVPLLMYADDIVMLASTVTELRLMNDVATEYAFKHRFRHNGKKSAVMMFNADKKTKDRVSREVWRLSGERVEVRDRYRYLGVEILQQVSDWKVHVKRLIGKAQARSRDLAWMCGRDSGIRPRSAATLWKAIVRPILEYASELWCGEIPQTLAQKVEAVQTNFARTILGLQGQQALSSICIRAELGLERLSSRWEKLRLGYWRRIQVAKPDRALVLVAAMRRRQLRWEGAAELSWMKQTRKLMRARGLEEHWTSPELCVGPSKDEWRDLVYERVEEHYERARQQDCASMTSVTRYRHVKCWEKMDVDRAVMTGEVSIRGSMVVERYLDDVKDRLGSRLKLMCRAGCVPVMSRVVWELGLAAHHGRCPLCNTGETESIDHMLMRCPVHQAHRSKMMAHVGAVYATFNDDAEFDASSEESQVRILLGARAGGKAGEDVIDVQVKRFLVKAWKARRDVSRVVNRKFDRMDVMWAKDWGRRWPDPSDEAEADTDAGSARTVAQRNNPSPLPRGGTPDARMEPRAPCRERSARKVVRASAPVTGARRRLFD